MELALTCCLYLLYFQLCDLMNKGEWTVERDEDLTAPYSFKDKMWIAFEDRISVSIKVRGIFIFIFIFIFKIISQLMIFMIDF